MGFMGDGDILFSNKLEDKLHHWYKLYDMIHTSNDTIQHIYNIYIYVLWLKLVFHGFWYVFIWGSQAGEQTKAREFNPQEERLGRIKS